MDILKNRRSTQGCAHAHVRTGSTKLKSINIKTKNMNDQQSLNQLKCSTLNEWVNNMNITNIELSRLTRYLFSDAFQIDFQNLSEVVENETEANEKYRLLIERKIINAR